MQAYPSSEYTLDPASGSGSDIPHSPSSGEGVPSATPGEVGIQHLAYLHI